MEFLSKLIFFLKPLGVKLHFRSFICQNLNLSLPFDDKKVVDASHWQIWVSYVTFLGKFAITNLGDGCYKTVPNV